MPRRAKSQTPPESAGKEYRIGKDEMNFAENPIALLADRSDRSKKTIRYSRMVEGKNGQTVEAEWVVTGSDEYGLPVADDEDIYLVLMEITKEAGFESRTVPISRYEIAKRMRLSRPSGKAYQRIKDAIARLVGVTIYASHWYDKGKKSHGDYMFHILESAILLDENPGRKSEKEGRKSSITWDRTVFGSFESGYIKNLDLDRYFALKSPISKRLYRLLDKRFFDGKPRFEIGLRLLAHEHLGISRNYQHDSKIKANMQKAHEEMVALGCISGYEFRDGQDGLIVVYYPLKPSAGALAESSIAGVGAVPSRARKSEEKEIPLPDGESEPCPLVAELVALGVSQDVALALVSAQAEEKIREKISFLPYAGAKNPGGWLRRAIEGDWQAPPAYRKAQREREKTERLSRAKAEKETTAQARDARLKEAEESLGEEDLRSLMARAEENARVKHPQAAQLADRGKGARIWKDILRTEFERLIMGEDRHTGP